MQCISYLVDGKDIIEHCTSMILDAGYVQGKKDKVLSKCLDKIIPSIQYFFETKMIPDGRNVVTLEDNIIEFRILLPKSKHLLRIISGYKQNNLVLLTGYLIKPQDYDDRKTKNSIDHHYERHIENAKRIWQDYHGAQHYDYIALDTII